MLFKREEVIMKKGIVAFISAVMGGVVGGLGGAVHVYRQEHKKLNIERKTTQKDDAILKMYAYWMERKQRGESLSEYFKRMRYQKIAIYGMHYLGQSLLSELEGSGIEVVCAIDKHAELRYTDIPLYKPEEAIPEVDAIIVTAFFFIDEIEEMLRDKMDCPIVSIEDIIYE